MENPLLHNRLRSNHAHCRCTQDWIHGRRIHRLPCLYRGRNHDYHRQDHSRHLVHQSHHHVVVALRHLRGHVTICIARFTYELIENICRNYSALPSSQKPTVKTEFEPKSASKNLLRLKLSTATSTANTPHYSPIRRSQRRVNPWALRV